MTLWRALHPPLLRYLTVRGDEAPEDIASETWMHVVKGLAGFVAGPQLTTVPLMQGASLKLPAYERR